MSDWVRRQWERKQVASMNDLECPERYPDSRFQAILDRVYALALALSSSRIGVFTKEGALAIFQPFGQFAVQVDEDGVERQRNDIQNQYLDSAAAVARQFGGRNLLEVCREFLQGKGGRRELDGRVREGSRVRDGDYGPISGLGGWIGGPRGEGDVQDLDNRRRIFILVVFWYQNMSRSAASFYPWDSGTTRRRDERCFKCGKRSANKSSDRMPTSPFTWSSRTSRADIAGLSCLRLLLRLRLAGSTDASEAILGDEWPAAAPGRTSRFEARGCWLGGSGAV